MRSLVPIGLLGTVLATAAPGCAPTAPSPDAVRDSVAAGAQRFMDAFRALDATAVAGLYAEEAILMPPNATLVNGRIGIRDFWHGAMQAGATSVRIEVQEVLGADSLAVEVGAYTLFGASGATMDQGKYLVVWKQAGAQWQIFRDIWNSNLPVVTQAIPAR